MKIGNQHIHYVEVIAWINKNSCFTFIWMKLAFLRRIVKALSCAFKTANAGCSHGDNALAGSFCLSDQLANISINIHDFTVHVMFENIIHSHWLERTCTNVQGYERRLYAFS